MVSHTAAKRSVVAGSLGASAGVFSGMGLCAPIPSGCNDGEFEGARVDGFISIDDAVDHGTCTGATDDAEVAGDGLAVGIRLGIGSAIPSTFVSPAINGVDTGLGVVASPGARFVAWIASSELLPAWFKELPEDTFRTGCVGELGNMLIGGMASGTGGKRTRDVKAELDPGGFLAEFFGEGVLVAAAVFPGCAEVFAKDAGSGAVV